MKVDWEISVESVESVERVESVDSVVAKEGNQRSSESDKGKVKLFRENSLFTCVDLNPVSLKQTEQFKLFRDLNLVSRK